MAEEIAPVCKSVKLDDLNECITTLNMLCEDLACELEARYKGTPDYPSQKRRFDNEMEPVIRGREIIERLSKIQ